MYSTQLAAWTSVVGVVLPLAISVLSQEKWSSKIKGLVATVVSVIAAVGTTYFADPKGLQTQPLIITIAAIVVLAESTYHSLWLPTGVSTALSRLTSPKTSR